MNQTIDTAVIIQKVKDGQISKNEALKIFESILNESENEMERKEAITSIGSLALNTNSVYKLLEKSMISDEYPLVRVEAAKVLLSSFNDLNLTPIMWAIENENSVLFFKHLLDFFELNPQKELTHIQSQVINKLTNVYNLEYSDLRFIIDLDYLEAIKFLNQYQEFINKFDVQQAYQRDLLLQNTSLNNKGLSRIDKKINGHIVHLTLHDLDLIPSSINIVPKLEKVKIDHCNFKGVDLNNLRLDSIKQLIFSNNQMDKLPNWVWRVANKKRYIKNFIKNGVMVSQAATLALIEILCEQSLKPIKNFEQPTLKSGHFYKLDEIGRVIGIFIANLPSKMGIVPNQICNLRYLEELHLVNQNIGEVPDCLIKLKKLKILNLSNNHITSIPENLEFMRNLEYIDLHVDEKEKEFLYVPNSIKNLHNLKILDLRGKNTKNLPESIKNLDYVKFDG